MSLPTPDARSSNHNKMDKKRLYKTSVCDYILAGIVIVFPMVFLFSSEGSRASVEKKARIYQDGRLLKEIALPLETPQTCRLGNTDITLEMSGKRLRIVKSGCSRNICVHSGWIENPGQMIVCVPNKVLIEISGTASAKDCDAVSY